MKSKPIIFTGESIPQILARTKSQTRRVMKRQPSPEFLARGLVRAVPQWPEQDGIRWFMADGLSELTPSPYRPGDVLWVREACRAEMFPHGGHGVAYLADEQYRPIEKTAGDEAQWAKLWNYRDGANILDGVGQTVPSIHMPRWASRISLEVTEVRAQRLWDISADDAKDEGMTMKSCAQALWKHAGSPKYPDACYVVDEYGEDVHGGYLCPLCATQLAEKGKGRDVSNAGCPESDGPAFCDECHTPILMSLTSDGIDRELFLEFDNGTNSKYFASDCAISAMIADGIGDLREEHKGRLRQIGYAARWDNLNAKRGYPWTNNDWVFKITFKLLDGKEFANG